MQFPSSIAKAADGDAWSLVWTAGAVVVLVASIVAVRARRARARRLSARERPSALPPVRGLPGALAVAVCALVGALVVTSGRGAAVQHDVARLRDLRGATNLLDERLTMSARLAAATGDAAWEERYRAAEGELDAVLSEADSLLHRLLGDAAAQAREGVVATGEFNDRLIALENECFGLVRAGRHDEAFALVLSADYEALKAGYAAASERYEAGVDALLRDALARDARLAFASGALFVTAIAAVAVGLFLLGRTLVRHVVALSESRSQLAAARDAAERATEAKATFLAHMSHELRTPLGAVIGMSELLLDATLPDDQRETAETIAKSSRALLELIDDVLDLSKIEAGKLSLENVPLDVRVLVEEVRAMLAARASGRGLALSVDVDAAVPRGIVADPARLRQILVNLVGNALKFTERGSVDLAVRHEARDGADELVFAVRDTGIGIDPERIGALFRPFVQAESSTTRRFGGTGLGLAICSQLAAAMGGGIDCESRPGRGTTFRVRIPLREADAPAAEPAAALPAVPGRTDGGVRGRVLVADDDAVNRRVAERMLARLGFDVVAVEDGAAALERIASESFDVVLMDCRMPVLDGYEATRRLRASGGPAAATRVVALTANAMAGDREECLAAGMDDYLAKPFRLAELEAMLARVLAARAA